MKRFLVLFLLAMAFTSPATAFSTEFGFANDMEFVADTRIPGPRGSTLVLCYETRDFKVFGYTFSSNITGYALATEACTQGADRAFSPAQMATAQSVRLIDPSLPTVAENTIERTLGNLGVWLAVSLALFAVIIRRIKSLLGWDVRGPMRKKASDRILMIMCYVGKCDGIVAANEIALISKTAQRFTRRTVRPAEVIKITDHLSMDLSPQDFINFGKGLRDAEKDIMMQAAFYVALASGRLLPAEHAFVTDLAYGIGMPGEDFRRVMNLTLIDLDIYPPAGIKTKTSL